MISILFSPNFPLKGIVLPLFPFIFLGEKIKIKIQIIPNWKGVSKYLQMTLNWILCNFQLIFHIIEEVILSSLVKIIELHKVSNLKYFWMEFKSFQNPFHLFKWKSHIMFTLGFCDKMNLNSWRA